MSPPESIARRSQQPKRQMTKCETCRSRKIACRWNGSGTRDFSKGQKCIQCEARGAACGPDTRAPRRRRPSVTANIIITTTTTTDPPASQLLQQTLSSNEAFGSQHQVDGPFDISNNPGPPNGPPVADGLALSRPGTPSTASSADPPSPLTEEVETLAEKKCKLHKHISVLGDLALMSRVLDNWVKEVQRLQRILDRTSTVLSDLILWACTNEAKAKELLDDIDRLLNELRQDVERHPDNEWCVELALRKCNEILPTFLVISAVGEVFSGRRHQYHKMLRKIYRERQEWSEVDRLDAAKDALGHQSKLMATNYRMAAGRLGGLLEISDGHRSDGLTEASRYSVLPLELAILDGNDDSAARLLAMPDAGIAENFLKRTAFHVLAEYDKPGLLQFLLSHGSKETIALKDCRDIFHRTPLLIAASQGGLDTFKLLIRSGSRIENRDRGSNSCLTLAAANGHEDIVSLALNQYGFDANDNPLGDMSPLFAAANGGHSAVCKLLLDTNLGDRQADPNANVRGKKPAEVAFENGHKELSSFIQGIADERERDASSQNNLDPVLSWVPGEMTFNEHNFSSMLNSTDYDVDMSGSFG